MGKISKQAARDASKGHYKGNYFTNPKSKEIYDEAFEAAVIVVEGGSNLQDGDKDWDDECSNCGASPTVHPTGLCGPCCFGEAETANGNW